jgi:hypothetical protein
MVVVVMCCVNDRSNTPDDLAMAPDEKKLYLGVLKEGVLTGIEKCLAFHDERRYPLTIMPIHLPGKPDKGFGVVRL